MALEATQVELSDLNPHLNDMPYSGGYNFLWGDPKYDHHSEDNTPEQNKML
jgi:hypothetical protein